MSILSLAFPTTLDSSDDRRSSEMLVLVLVLVLVFVNRGISGRAQVRDPNALVYLRVTGASKTSFGPAQQRLFLVPHNQAVQRYRVLLCLCDICWGRRVMSVDSSITKGAEHAR